MFSSVVLRGIFCFWETACCFLRALVCFPLFAWLLVAVSEREVWREKLASEHQRPRRRYAKGARSGQSGNSCELAYIVCGAPAPGARTGAGTPLCQSGSVCKFGLA